MQQRDCFTDLLKIVNNTIGTVLSVVLTLFRIAVFYPTSSMPKILYSIIIMTVSQGTKTVLTYYVQNPNPLNACLIQYEIAVFC